MENISSLHTLLHTSRKVCIISHTNPDGDAIGSITAMASYISRRCGADAVPMVPDRYPANLSFIARGRMTSARPISSLFRTLTTSGAPNSYVH